jgi:hypothetical protein
LGGRSPLDWSPDCRWLWEVFVEPKGPDEGRLGKAPMAAVPQGRERTAFPWPWGLVAIGVMALAWVGIYLVWNGVVFLFNW